MIISSYYVVALGGGFLTYDGDRDVTNKYRVTMDITQAERFHQRKNAATVAEAYVGIVMKITINGEEVK